MNVKASKTLRLFPRKRERSARPRFRGDARILLMHVSQGPRTRGGRR
jgi:hypothetical protein